MTLFAILAAIVILFLFSQWTVLNAGWLAQEFTHRVEQSADALIHPSTTSPTSFAALVAFTAICIGYRRRAIRLLGCIAIMAVPAVTFLFVLSTLMIPRIGSKMSNDGQIHYHDWSGMFSQRQSEAAHAQRLEIMESNTAAPAEWACRRNIDIDDLSEMTRACAAIACDRIEKGTVETDHRTISTHPEAVGKPRRHTNLESVCDSLHYD